jgi:hypothetical protein
VHVQSRAGPSRVTPSNLTDEYTTARNKLREDLVSLAAKAMRNGVDDGVKWQLILEMLSDGIRVEGAVSKVGAQPQLEAQPPATSPPTCASAQAM